MQPPSQAANDEEKALVAIQKATGLTNVDFRERITTGTNGRVVELDLSGFLSMVRVPVEIGVLADLRKLHLCDWVILTRLPRAIGDLKRLQCLDLACCGKLVALPPEISRLPHLLELNLSHCTSLTVLPWLDQLKELTKLNLCTCISLLDWPEGIWSLSKLKYLEISLVDNLTTVPPEIGMLIELEVLKIGCCKNLIEISGEIGQLKKLKILDLESDYSKPTALTKLPMEIGRLESLECLNLSVCINMMEVPCEIGSLSKLCRISLFGCAQISSIPREILSLPNLAVLDLQGCSRLTTTPKDIFKHSYSLTNVTACDRSAQAEFDVYTRWNKAGRCLLRSHNVPDALWAKVLGKIGAKDYSVMFLFLREQPSLCNYVTAKKGNKRISCPSNRSCPTRILN